MAFSAAALRAVGASFSPAVAVTACTRSSLLRRRVILVTRSTASHFLRTGTRTWSAVGAADVASPKLVTLMAELKVGDTVEATVKKKIKSGIIVDIGVEMQAIIDAGELRDGFPTSGMPKPGTKLTARVLNMDAGDIRLTRRTGSLERPPRRHISTDDFDPTPLIGVDPRKWHDGEVFAISRWGVFVNVRGADGKGAPILGLVRVKEFSDGYVDEACVGGPVRVRVLAVDASTGRVSMSMREHSAASSS
eukprot:TRINITY_DN61813_c0_g1_i1.p1 TRINITY_DN61813_c0_g1~~TRINITY_DN61813_c0_g1_i1.p1  ORF type:complete len:264 (+),score=35.79 TRINITY_DN61813_c0_g1_i1:48-794(+)